MKSIPRSKEFVKLYDIISNNSFKGIGLLYFDSEMFLKMSLFENYIISVRMIDICSSQQNIYGGVEIIIKNSTKRIKKLLDIFIETDLSNTYFNNDRWDILHRLKGKSTMNTKTGFIEDNKENLAKWKKVRESSSYNYAKYILNYVCESKKKPSYVNYYTAGIDVISDMEYYLFGCIYYLFIEETILDVSERKKILFLSLVAEHLNINTYKKWEKRALIDYFLNECKV